MQICIARKVTVMSDRRSYDRLIGILTTVTGGLLLYVAHHWVKQLVVQYKKEKKENKPNTTPDDLHELRYNKKSLVIHNGSCHCERVRFRIKAPKVLNAVDIPSKIVLISSHQQINYKLFLYPQSQLQYLFFLSSKVMTP